MEFIAELIWSKLTLLMILSNSKMSDKNVQLDRKAKKMWRIVILLICTASFIITANGYKIKRTVCDIGIFV